MATIGYFPLKHYKKAIMILKKIIYIRLICVNTERNTHFSLSVNVLFKHTGSERRQKYALDTRSRGS